MAEGGRNVALDVLVRGPGPTLISRDYRSGLQEPGRARGETRGRVGLAEIETQGSEHGRAEQRRYGESEDRPR